METIDQLASEMIRQQSNPKVISLFMQSLRQTSNITKLMSLAEQYTPHSEVSLPVLDRVLEIDPSLIQAIIQKGWVLWLLGDDLGCKEMIEKGKNFDPNNTSLMCLEAANERDVTHQIKLYQKVLEFEPTNEIALDNLNKLGSVDI